MRIYLIIIALLPAFSIFCSDNPTENIVNNVNLICQIPDDPLHLLIDSAEVTVTAPDIAVPQKEYFHVSAMQGGYFILTLDVEAGLSRQFRVMLKDSDSRALHYSVAAGDVSRRHILNLYLTFHQTGFGTATSVIIFRDQLPWDSRALDSVLIQQGFSLGTGAQNYYVYPSAAMPDAELRPESDLVVISNDQPQWFYDNYAASQNRFEQFVRDGGTMLWCACDLGWNYGSISAAGISLPGGIEIDYALDQVNLSETGGFEILHGLPDTLYGNYASQESFAGLPAGALEYLVDTAGGPTLLGFPLGNGWVVFSGQPLEYNYDRRETYNIGELLPRVIRFLLGIAPEESLFLFPGNGALERQDQPTLNSAGTTHGGAPRQ
jgi:hypothetical protein